MELTRGSRVATTRSLRLTAVSEPHGSGSCYATGSKLITAVSRTSEGRWGTARSGTANKHAYRNFARCTTHTLCRRVLCTAFSFFRNYDHARIADDEAEMAGSASSRVDPPGRNAYFKARQLSSFR